MAAVGAVHNGLISNQAPQIDAVAIKGIADGYDYDGIEVRWHPYGIHNARHQFQEIAPGALAGFAYPATGLFPTYSEGTLVVSFIPLGLFRYANTDKIWLTQDPLNSAISPLEAQGSYFEFTSDYVPPTDDGGGGGTLPNVPTGSGFSMMYECLFGDGASMQVERDGSSTLYDDTPLVFPHTYAQPGAYTIQVNQYWRSTAVGSGWQLYAFDQATITLTENLNFALAIRVLGKSTQFL